MRSSPVSTLEPDESPTVDELLDRWRELSEGGEEPDLEVITEGASEATKAEFMRRIADIQAGEKALRQLRGIDEDENGIPFQPSGAAGRYLGPEILESGGMGFLCVAADVELKRHVAYKVMHPRYGDDCAKREQFLNEAVITAKLHHPGIVPIFGIVEDDSGLPAYAMELVDAPNLTDVIVSYHALGVPATKAWNEIRARLLQHFAATCRIAAYAHEEHSVVHGDIKPLNILVDENFGATWLVDWGLARVVTKDESPAGPTPQLATGPFRGPSLRDGARPTFASDIHSLGVTLAVILAGPRWSPTCPDASDPRLPAPEIPAALWAIARKAMQPAREDRYASAKEMAEDVEKWLNDRSVSVYRDPLRTVARRWVGQHSTAVTAAALSALMFVIGIISLALISSARDRAALKANEAAQYREESLRSKADSYVYYAAFAEHKLLTPAERSTPFSGAEMVRSLLRLLEHRDEEPQATARHAREFLEMIATMEKEDAKQKEAARNAMVANLGKGVDVVEELTGEFPTKPRYRALLGRYYCLFGAVQSSPVTDLAGYEKLLAGSRALTPQQRAKIEAALALFDKSLATLPPDDADVHKYWFYSSLGRAMSLMQLGRFTESVLAFNRVITLAEAAEQAMYVHIQSIMFKAAEMEQSRMPWSRGQAVDHAKAMRMAEALANHEGVSTRAVYNAACAFSLASLDPSASADDRTRRADQAMTYLERIAAQGYFDPKMKTRLDIPATTNTLLELQNDPDLDPLRSRPDFKALLTRAAASERSQTPNL
jgi:serine/threonine protein kinase